MSPSDVARLSALQQMTETLRSSRGSDVAGVVLEHAARTLAAHRSGLFLFDEPAAELRLVASVGYPSEVKVRFGHALLQSDSPLAKSYRLQRPLFYPTYAQYKREFPSLAMAPADTQMSFCCIPLTAGDNRIGVLSFAFPEHRAFTDSERQFFDAVATQAAIAVERAQMLAAQQAISARNDRLFALVSALGSAVTEEQAASCSVKEALDAFDGVGAGVHLLDEERSVLRFVAGANMSEAAIHRWLEIPLNARLQHADAVKTRRPVFVSTGAEWAERYPDAAAAPIAPPGARFALPLVAHGRVLGVMSMAFEEDRAFDQDDQDFAEAVAAQCAQAIERAQLFDAQRNIARRVSFLAGATHALNASLALEDTLQTIAGLMLPSYADYCFFDVVQEDGSVRRVARAHDNAKIQAILDQTSWVKSDRTDLNLCALSSGEAALHEVIDADFRRKMAANDEHLSLLEEIQLNAMITVPVTVQGRLDGALTLCMGQSGRRYSHADLLLAQEAAERVAVALHHARLYEQAQAAVKIRDEFLSIAGHELNTPLTALKLQLERLKTAKPDNVEAIRGALMRQTDRVGRLVRELLDVSRISGGRLLLEPEPFDMGELLKDIATRFRESRDGLDLSVSVEGDTSGRWDRIRLEQVVQNLISNAVKYGENKPIRVQLKAEGERLHLLVKDHGLGIAATELPRLFRKFERLVPANQYGGFGLGLWITRQVIDAHGGTISLRSAPGEGTSVEVDLPRLTHRVNT